MTGNSSAQPNGSRSSRAPDQSSQAAEANLSAAHADQTAADADQTASDTDQSASDADEAAAERDDADAAEDQRSSDRDQAAADRSAPADDGGAARGAYDKASRARDATTIRRTATRQSRARTTRTRGDSAGQRDATAARRDESAKRRDARAREFERAVANAMLPLSEKLEEMRARAADDRERAAKDRARAAADRAEAARERARLEAELESAHLDGLTRTYRREAGWLALNHEIDRARRGDGRFVVAFVDVDGLKRVNDEEGHAAGDRVLRALGDTLRSHLRSFDPVVRYGGDEFVCGLGAIDVDDVVRRFDLICLALEDAVSVGISTGFATLAADETLEELVARADAKLLDAKKARGHEGLGRPHDPQRRELHLVTDRNDDQDHRPRLGAIDSPQVSH